MPKNVRLKKLSLTNYRNIEHAELDFSGRNCAIVGENHVGKTNTLESLFVLLDDSLLNGSSNLPSIKPLADTKRVTSIEATFDVDGDDFTVRKDYGEDWVRARGTDTLTMKGHFQTLFIQGTKVERTKEFYKTIRDKFGIRADDADKIDYMRMLLAPNYLGDMGEGKDWTALRAFVIKLVGDVSDDDVFLANPELDIIKYDLKSQNGLVEQLKRKYKQDCDGLEMTIKQCEAVVSSLEKTEKPTDESVAVAKRAIEEKDSDIARIRASNGTDVESERLQRELSDAQATLIEETRKAKESFVDPHEQKRKELRERYQKANQTLTNATVAKSTVTSEIVSEEATIRRLEAERCQYSPDVNAKLIERISEIDSSPAKVDETCPTCGQPLPAEKIAEARANVEKAMAEERNALVAKCHANKAKRSEIDEEIVKRKERVAKLQDDEEAHQKSIDEAKAEIASVTELANKIPAVAERNETEAEAKAKAKVDEISAKLKESRSAFQNGLQDSNSAIARLQDEKAPFQKVIDDLSYYERQIEKLKSERENLATKRKQLAVAEQKRECASQFIYAKLRLLDENVSKVFGGIRIKLIQENINGGFDPVCKPYIYDTVKGVSTGVSWAAGSKSERVETGIAICEAVKRSLGLPDIPYLFDEGGEISSETFSTRLATGSQLICVKVRDGIDNPTVLPL